MLISILLIRAVRDNEKWPLVLKIVPRGGGVCLPLGRTGKLF
jgi:hypothetical protein